MAAKVPSAPLARKEVSNFARYDCKGCSGDAPEEMQETRYGILRKADPRSTTRAEALEPATPTSMRRSTHYGAYRNMRPDRSRWPRNKAHKPAGLRSADAVR